MKQRASLDHVPIYIVSGCASQSMAYSTIVSEWLVKSKQDNAYEARLPFLHTDYIRDGRIIPLSGVQQRTFKQRFSSSPSSSSSLSPCIVFASHPSLRFGPVIHFLKWYLWLLMLCHAMPSNFILSIH
jgi:integrator complex subunit 9